jgi:hypothetical protein
MNNDADICLKNQSEPASPLMAATKSGNLSPNAAGRRKEGDEKE